MTEFVNKVLNQESVKFIGLGRRLHQQ